MQSIACGRTVNLEADELPHDCDWLRAACAASALCGCGCAGSCRVVSCGRLLAGGREVDRDASRAPCLTRPP
jgi:hypothetical protein